MADLPPAAQIRAALARASSLADAAARVGCSVAHLSRLASGERRPSWRLAERLASELGVPADAWRSPGARALEASGETLASWASRHGVPYARALAWYRGRTRDAELERLALGEVAA